MNNSTTRFSIKRRWQSFQYAFSGIRALFLYEHNSRIHLVAAILAITLGVILRISEVEWLVIIGIIALVFVAEILNSSIETIADFVSPEYNDAIQKVKDYCAAAVLIASIASAIIGLLVFLPKIISRL